MTAEAHAELRARIDRMIDNLIGEFYERIPSANHLRSAERINEEYYKRYTVEIILRLRMKRTIDALAIHYFTKRDPRLAKKWCQYAEDEMLHDAMFFADLERLGMTREEVYKTEPFLATKLLQGYFYYGLEHEGAPLANISSSYFIEYISDRTQRKWLANVEKSLGKDAVKGSRAHTEHDEEDDHLSFVWDVLSSFIKTKADEEKIVDHIKNVYHLFMMFFIELHNAVIEKKKEPFESVYAVAAE
jgi:hypothetical protein